MSRGDRRHRVTLAGAGTTTVNSDGEYVPGSAPLTPALWWCSINPANVRDLERLTGASTVAQATYILEGDYHAGITTQTTVTLDSGQVLYVNGVQDPELRHARTICFCSEQQT